MPQRGEKGQYGYVRQSEEKPKKCRKKRVRTVDEPIDEFPNEIGMFGIPDAGPSHLHPAMEPSGMGVHHLHPTIASLHQAAVGSPYTGVIAEPSPNVPVPTGIPNARATRNEEELEDEGTEWAVRVGDAPPPMWAKRREPDNRDDDDGYSKRPRLEKLVHLLVYFRLSIEIS